MWQRFRESARRVIMLAQQEAAKKNSAFVESEHLLAGLLLEPGSIVTQIFNDLSIQPTTLQPSLPPQAVEDAKATEPSLLQRALKDARERDALLSPPEVEELGSHFKVDPQLVRQIESYVLRKLREQNNKPELALSAQAKQALEFAADEARRMRHNAISPEHLLVALLRQGDSDAARSLNEAGLDLKQARALVVRHVQAHDDQAD